MNHFSSLSVLALQIASVALLSGCIAYEEGIEEGELEEIAVAEERLESVNALTINALTTNALTTNALTTNALTTNALTTNALTTNSLVYDALRGGATRQLFSYVVSCALPAGSQVQVTIDNETYAFPGQIGIAPEWGAIDGTCDAKCKGWVSACVLARVNYLGVQVPLSVRADKDPFKRLSPTEATDYPRREATYYGDIFAQPQVRYACLSPGETSIPRVCGPSLDDCVMDVVGSCEDACDAPKTNGAFPKCRDMPRDPVTGQWPTGSQSYAGSVTVFLKP